MGLIVLEAALALAVLVFLIWWTMFSGRSEGEWHDEVGPLSPDHDRESGFPASAAPPLEPAQPTERGGTRKDQG